jgi:T-complex protein 1 subunit gamma
MCSVSPVLSAGLVQMLLEKAKSIEGIQAFAYKVVASALEIIPKTLVENCGGSSIRLLTDLRGRHAEGKNVNLGIDGNKGTIEDMGKLNIFDTFSVKAQTYKTALEVLLFLFCFSTSLCAFLSHPSDFL